MVNWGGDLMAPLTQRRARARRGGGFLRELLPEEEDGTDRWARDDSGSKCGSELGDVAQRELLDRDPAAESWRGVLNC